MSQIDEVLAEAGITKDHPDWGLEYNLCHAAISGGLGIRSGQCQAVKDVIKRRQEAPVIPEEVFEFKRKLDEWNQRLTGANPA